MARIGRSKLQKTSAQKLSQPEVSEYRYKSPSISGGSSTDPRHIKQAASATDHRDAIGSRANCWQPGTLAVDLP